MVASGHPEVILGRQLLIATENIDYQQAADYGSIDDDGADFEKEDESGLGEAVVSTGVTEVVTKEVEEV